jgi:2-dehydropantoate 2-reductase
VDISNRIAVIGAGGIGAYYVSRLAAAGQPVLAVARGEHLWAIRRNGLAVQHPQHPFHGHVPVCDMGAFKVEKPCDFAAIVLLTKTTATAAIASELRDWLADAPTPVLSLQNGVDNEPVLTQALGGERVVGGYSVRLGGHIVAPGHVSCVGEGLTCIGAWPHADPANAAAGQHAHHIAQIFNAAGLETRVTENVRRELWRKLVLNAGVNPLSALLEWDTRRLSHDPQVSALVRDIMHETVRVGRAEGIELDDEDAREMFDLIEGFAPIRTSMLVDLDHGRETEMDAICGALLRRSERHEVDVPVLRTVAALLDAKLAGEPVDQDA